MDFAPFGISLYIVFVLISLLYEYGKKGGTIPNKEFPY